MKHNSEFHKNPPLLKWYDPGPQEEPPHIKELLDTLGLLSIQPQETEEGTQD